MEKSLILVIEDTPDVRALIEDTLDAQGYEVVTAANGQQALAVLRVRKPQTVLLDLVLPDGDGLALIAEIRKFGRTPIIIVSGKGGVIDKVVGLEMGADDYLTKPFDVSELSARVKASVRRYRESQGAASGEVKAARVLRFEQFLLDEMQYQVFDSGGASCGLTTSEFQLLQVLVRAPNRVFSREQLLDAMKCGDLDINDRAIDTQIARIRRKLGDGRENDIIKTVRNVGYMLACDTGEVRQ